MEVLVDALAPGKPGPAEREEKLTVNNLFIKKAISVFPFLKGTVRDVQLGLRLLFGVSRSIGFIGQTLSEAGARAKEINLGVSIPLPILGEADEIFQGRKPLFDPRGRALVFDFEPDAVGFQRRDDLGSRLFGPGRARRQVPRPDHKRLKKRLANQAKSLGLQLVPA